MQADHTIMPGLGSDISWLIYWAKDASQYAPNMLPCMSLIYTTNIWRYHPLGHICQQSLTNTKSKGTRILQPLLLSKGYSQLTASMTSLQHKEKVSTYSYCNASWNLSKNLRQISMSLPYSVPFLHSCIMPHFASVKYVRCPIQTMLYRIEVFQSK